MPPKYFVSQASVPLSQSNVKFRMENIILRKNNCFVFLKKMLVLIILISRIFCRSKSHAFQTAICYISPYTLSSRPKECSPSIIVIKYVAKRTVSDNRRNVSLGICPILPTIPHPQCRQRIRSHLLISSDFDFDSLTTCHDKCLKATWLWSGKNAP